MLLKERLVLPAKPDEALDVLTVKYRRVETRRRTERPMLLLVSRV